MASRLEVLQSAVQEVLGDKVKQSALALDELTVVCEVDNVIDVATLLRDHADLAFEQCSDLCGVDYSAYQDGAWSGARYAVVYQLISYRHNWRIRLKTFAKDDAFPIVPSVVDIWNGVNWYEREAFDLFGILFDGHPDLRRILTDYGFIGHPFRKDFPLSGYVEMRYDATEARVIYQPVTIEPREITPRIIREENYGG